LNLPKPQIEKINHSLIELVEINEWMAEALEATYPKFYTFPFNFTKKTFKKL